jgi:hypothetical protein
VLLYCCIALLLSACCLQTIEQIYLNTYLRTYLFIY